MGFAEAWSKHCKDSTILEKYALSMATLAQDHWDPNSETDFAESRITWVHQHCENYYKNGGLQVADVFELKKMAALTQNQAYELKYAPSTPEDLKLRLLDVGSCYNPFSKFPLFDVTAIDIAPGHETVKKCDFINIKICSESDFKPQNNSVTSLPPDSFDIVVFSLLLEYFPNPEARFQCCENAYKILKSRGVLIIITPDSKHATANAPLMRQWKVALATLGFWRVDYEKLHHLHCMTFRKSCDVDFPKFWATREMSKCEQFQRFDSAAHMMSIPQDNKVEGDSNTSTDDSKPKVEVDSKMFDELPNDLSD